MSIRDMDTVFTNGRGFDEEFVKGAVKVLLKGVDFLHTEVQSVHTGRLQLPLPSLHAPEYGSSPSIAAETRPDFTRAIFSSEQMTMLCSSSWKITSPRTLFLASNATTGRFTFAA